MRAVLDVNVLVAGVLSFKGSPAEILRRGRDGDFELIASAALLSELRRTLGYPKIRQRVPADQAKAFVRWVEAHATLVDDPNEPPALRSPDPDDDYLIALAGSARAYLVTGDRHLLGLSEELPILAPAGFLAALDRWATAEPS